MQVSGDIDKLFKIWDAVADKKSLAKQTGKFSKTMWDVLMSYFTNKVSKCEVKYLI